MFYDAETLKTTEGVGMTRGGMILFALLCGGDYDTKVGPEQTSSIVIHSTIQRVSRGSAQSLLIHSPAADLETTSSRHVTL